MTYFMSLTMQTLNAELSQLLPDANICTKSKLFSGPFTFPDD